MRLAFIFDYGNVISTVQPEVFGKRVLPLAGCTPLELRDRVTGAHDLMVAYESGLIDTETFVPQFLERLGLKMSRGEFIEAWSCFFVPIPYTRRLIRAVKPHARVALLSNTNPLHFEHVIRQTDLFPLFEAVTVSFEVRAMKPAPAIYHDMIQKLRLPPAECVFIDDLRENVEAAAAVGMQALHFTTPGAFHEQLLALPLEPGLRSALLDIHSQTER